MTCKREINLPVEKKKKKRKASRREVKQRESITVILSIAFCLYIEIFLSGCGTQLATISRLMRKASHEFHL